MAKKIILAVALLCVGLVAVVCLVIRLQPSTFTVERSAAMAAPPAAVFAQIKVIPEPEPSLFVSSPASFPIIPVSSTCLRIYPPPAIYTGCRHKHDFLIAAEFLAYQMRTPLSV